MVDCSRQISEVTVQQLLCLYRDVLSELKSRGVVRTHNAPIADYAEWLVSQKLGLKLTSNSNAGYDAENKKGSRYQIKARWLDTPETQRFLSVIRNLDKDPFDYLIVLLFDRNFEVQEAYEMHISTVKRYARYRPYINGYVISMKGDILNDPGVRNLLPAFRD